MPSQNFGLINLMLWKQSMDNKKKKLGINRIHMKYSKIYHMGS